MNGLNKTLALLIFVVTFTECGRKQRTLFQFPEKESISINKLTLPTARGLQITAQNNDALLTWLAVDLPDITTQSPNQPIILVGYHIYRFPKGRFVTKTPITKQPVQTTQFRDSSRLKNKKQFCYMVRAIFSIDNHIFQGPASRIARING